MAGFTLLELLVASAIFAVVLVLLASVIGSLMSVWQQGLARSERRNAAVSVFGHLKRDLPQSALPADVNGARLQCAINPSGLSATYKLPCALFLSAPVATDRSRGDLAAVGYFVQWVDNAPKLCRFLLNPSHSSVTPSATNGWIDDALLSANAPATRASDYAGLLVDNVLGLWVRPLDEEGNTIDQTGLTNASGQVLAAGQFDSSAGYQRANGVRYSAYATNGIPAPGHGALPASLEVAIVVVDNRTARRLTGNEKPAAASTNFWDAVNTFYAGLPPEIRQGAEIQSTRINLPSRPR